MWNRFVAMGDSVTEGIGDDVEGIPCLSWAYHFAKEWQERYPELIYTNIAIRGQTTAEIRRTQLGKCMALRPDLVSLMAGGNDVLQGRWNASAFEQEFGEMLSTLLQTGVTIISSTVPDFPKLRTLPTSQAGQIRSQLTELNQLIREKCVEFGVPYAELWHAPFTLNLETWSRDGIHPNSVGYMALAGAMNDVLLQIKNTPNGPLGGISK
ncbi:SGNH/GDSL hydrolase family protein [Bacillus canaveralius]|uniref:SGNH/GDSL hydrolase family protein n=1 Tax=Bacillus canaveralius TaxID=1403243 RepID=UPI000F7B17A7|nr:SGNH/GDSL hydrolase family protein [Bacillus canaveralius]RSK53789.1 SGNH/GDSL hydrolase family protein [Bacillus canaveralius]